MSYSAFLESKRRNDAETGVAVTADECHPMLHDWQSEIVAWAAAAGRAAIFADCGLGKTFMQLEWARLVGTTSLIVAPLSVARQTIKEAAKIGLDPVYVRSSADVAGPGLWVTNYEMLHEFDPTGFDAVVLDESSILKNHTGATRTQLVEQWADTKHRLCCTATPAPNDVTELCNHAEFLGYMTRTEMLAAYFVHDQDGWRVKGHAVDPMFKWMASWATAIRKPSDHGYDDAGYELPPLRIHAEIVSVNEAPEGQLFATDLGGVGGRAAVRRQTAESRVGRAVDLVNDGHEDDQWIVWCGLNAEAEAVTAGLPSSRNVSGSDSPESKAADLEAFQDGEYRVLVTKPSIAGFGMNFQNAHRMCFVGLSDSYEQYYQAIRRCWRFGQSSPVDVHIVVSELESQIVANVARKEKGTAGATERLVEAMRTRWGTTT